MTLAVAVAATVAANAAAITWGSGTVSLADGTKAGKGDVTAYLFLLDADTYNTLAANATGAAMSDAVYAAYGDKIDTANASNTTTGKGIANLSDPTTYANGSTAYAAVLYIEGDNYMGNVATYTLDSDMDASVGGLATTVFGNVGSSTTSTAWSTAAVPEPTSGLLMLLGMAGLALKRKRV